MSKVTSTPTSTTTDLWVAAACGAIYGYESLVGIDKVATGYHQFTLALSPEEFQKLVRDYALDELGVFAKAFAKAHQFLNTTQRAMTSRGEASWRCSAWVEGRINF